eukprot:1552732-Rhodomonas_salina.1
MGRQAELGESCDTACARGGGRTCDATQLDKLNNCQVHLLLRPRQHSPQREGLKWSMCRRCKRRSSALAAATMRVLTSQVPLSLSLSLSPDPGRTDEDQDQDQDQDGGGGGGGGGDDDGDDGGGGGDGH